jgi:hypothetical protein
MTLMTVTAKATRSMALLLAGVAALALAPSGALASTYRRLSSPEDLTVRTCLLLSSRKGSMSCRLPDRQAVSHAYRPKDCGGMSDIREHGTFADCFQLLYQRLLGDESSACRITGGLLA